MAVSITERLRASGWAMCLVWLGTTALGPACSSGESKPEARSELPPLEFDEATPNLVLTYLDERGDPHVTAKPSGVPTNTRDKVRVVLTDREAGSGDPIYVADLEAPDGAGRFVAHSMPRSDWEEMISRRRSQAPPREAQAERPPRPALPQAPLPPADRPPAPPAGGVKPSESPSGLTVIVYGAEWCGPCHQALDHLKRQNIKSVFKDIDRDASARREMSEKLEKVHGRSGSIPVIDVGGRILVGYSRGALDQALSQAAGGRML